MADDYGLIGGVGEGLNSFINAYTKTKLAQREQQQKETMMKIQAAGSGFDYDPVSGSLTETPEHMEAKKAGLFKAKYEGGEYDPENPRAGFLANITKEQVKAMHPEYTDDQLNQIVTPGQPAAAYKEGAGLLKPELSGYYGYLGRKAQADTYGKIGAERNSIAREGLNLRTQKAANDINKEVYKDKIVQSIDTIQGSLTKGLQQLNSKEKPITLGLLNEIQNDYANSLQNGRIAAQGTIHDIQMKTLQGKLANLKQYLTGDPTQAATPEQIAYFKTAFKELQQLGMAMREKRVKAITGGAEQAFGNNGAFGNVINNLNNTANGSGLLPDASSGYDQDVLDYAKTHNISNDQAQIIKMRRTGQ